MAANSTLTTTEVNAILEQQWEPDILLKGQEERVISRGFRTADGVQKIGNTLNISIATAPTAIALLGTAAATGTVLNYHTPTELNLQCLPSRIYAGVQMSMSVQSRLLRFQNYMQALKDQLIASLVASYDATAATETGNLATSVVGGPGQDITESLLFSAFAKLAQNSKNHFKIGITPLYITVYPLQIDNLMPIQSLYNAQFRGDGENPYPKGWAQKGYNADIRESGLVLQSGGLALNLVNVMGSHVLDFNEQPHILPDQWTGLARRVIATAEFGVKEIFDEDAALIQTVLT